MFLPFSTEVGGDKCIGKELISLAPISKGISYQTQAPQFLDPMVLSHQCHCDSDIGPRPLSTARVWAMLVVDIRAAGFVDCQRACLRHI